MSKIHLLGAGELLVQALKDFSSFYGMNLQWEPAQIENLKEKPLDQPFVLHNEFPEKLGLIKSLDELRKGPPPNFTPVLVLSEELSPAAFHLYNELEMVWQSFLPFDARQFFEKLDQVATFTQDNQSLIQTRNQIAVKEQDGKFQEAIKLIDQIEAEYPHSNQLQLAKANIFLKSGDDDAAKNCLKLLKRNGFDGLLFRELVMQVLEKPMDDKKRKHKMRNMEKSNNKFWGDRYMENGQPQSAHRSYKSILELEPDEDQKTAALVGMKLAEFAGATPGEQDLDGVDPLEVARALNKRSVSLVANGEYAMAESLYQKAIAALPDNSLEHKLWFNLALCYKKKGDLQRALGYFEKSDQIGPEDYVRAKQQIAEVQKMIEFDKEEMGLIEEEVS